jgi:hypothetical protein
MTATNTSFDPPMPPAGAYPVPPPQRPVATRRGTGAMVIGAVLLGLGFLTMASGAALLFLFGGGQILSSGQHAISTGSSALVTDLGQINGIDEFRAITGSPTVSLSAVNVGDDGVFVGVGPTEDVERYLSGVPTERITDLELSPFRMDTRAVDGSTVATAPGKQGFWVASSESVNEAALNWRLDDGRYEIVVMNADGSPGFVTSAQIGVALPDSSGLWITVLAVGGAAMIIGGALVVVGVRSNKQR